MRMSSGTQDFLQENYRFYREITKPNFLSYISFQYLFFFRNLNLLIVKLKQIFNGPIVLEM